MLPAIRRHLPTTRGHGELQAVYLHLEDNFTSLPLPKFLSPADLRSVVRLAPLIAIDLIIRNRQEEVLLGLCNNEPAKGFYFVPGGMILKNERLRDAFARLWKNETLQALGF